MLSHWAYQRCAFQHSDRSMHFRGRNHAAVLERLHGTSVTRSGILLAANGSIVSYPQRRLPLTT